MSMRHKLYAETDIMVRLKNWRLSNLDGTIDDARAALRSTLTTSDINMLFDNWLNHNFPRIEITEHKPGSVVAKVISYRAKQQRSASDTARQRQIVDAAAEIAARGVKTTLYQEFSARIWETVLPSGVILKNATGKDMREAGGWYSTLADKMKSTEKVARKFGTRDLFNVQQRFAKAA